MGAAFMEPPPMPSTLTVLLQVYAPEQLLEGERYGHYSGEKTKAQKQSNQWKNIT